MKTGPTGNENTTSSLVNSHDRRQVPLNSGTTLKVCADASGDILP